MTHSRKRELDVAVARLAGLPLPDLFSAVHKLLALSVELDSSITDPAIAETTRYEARKLLFQRGMRGAYAAEKIEHYLWMWEFIDSLRQDLNFRLEELRQAQFQLDPGDQERAAIGRAMSGLSGKQDVIIHLYTTCIAQINGLLPVMASAAAMGMTASRSELETRLLAFQKLRDVFEHLEDHLPQRPNAHLWVAEFEDTPDSYRVRIGLRFDAQGHIVLGDRTIDVSAPTLEEIRRLVEKVFGEAQVALLSRARRCWESSSDPIPNNMLSGLSTYAASPKTHPGGLMPPENPRQAGK